MRTAAALNYLIAERRLREKNRDINDVMVKIATIGNFWLAGHAYYDTTLEAVVLTSDDSIHPHYIDVNKVVWIRELENV